MERLERVDRGLAVDTLMREISAAAGAAPLAMR